MVSVNGIIINFKPPGGFLKTYRGMHILVINPNGFIETTKIFDTYSSSYYFEKFINTWNLPKGYIIVAGCRNDCMNNLSITCLEWFQGMGSRKIAELKYRHSFAFIGIIGQTECIEKIGKDPYE